MADAPSNESNIIQAISSDRLWFDPLMLTIATSVRISNIVMVGNVAAILAPSDPNRWGVGFYQGTAGTSLSVAPWPDLQNAVMFASTISITIPFLTLFNLGPLVSSQWWGLPGFNATIRVVELLRNSGA